MRTLLLFGGLLLRRLLVGSRAFPFRVVGAAVVLIEPGGCAAAHGGLRRSGSTTLLVEEDAQLADGLWHAGGGRGDACCEDGAFAGHVCGWRVEVEGLEGFVVGVFMVG